MSSRTPSRRTRARRTTLGALAVVGLLALSACGLRPGTAAEIGADRISHDEVNEVASALCAANLSSAAAQGAPPPELPSVGARVGALQVLVDSSLARQFGESEGAEADPGELSATLTQNEPGIAALPADRQDAFREALREFTRGQLLVIDVGRGSLASAGQGGATDDQALAEGRRLQAEFVAGLDVEIDPRYGDLSEGIIVPGSPSLSVAVSQTATDAARGNASPEYIAGLPATQLCS
ncbi:MAG: hypothetical protein Q8Q02_02625 [Nocardioides sp.]|nr:hypothetical protein [Nocardioides sp.]